MKRGRMRRRNTGRSLLVIWIIVMLVFMSIDGAGIRSAAALADSNDAPDDGGFLVHDTFESDAVGEIPLGYTATSASDAGALVSDTQAHEGTQSVKVYDQSATKLAEMVKTFPAQSSVTLDFALYPVSVADAAGAIQFSLLGEGTDVYSSVFHMKVSADGSLSYYNGSAWMPVSGPDTVVFNAWNAIRVVANDTENAEIYVNDLFVGTANHFANASSLGGIRFATGGSNQLGDEFFVDDVRVVGSEEEALDMIVNDTFESDTVGEIPAGYIVTKSGTDAEALVSDAQAYDGSSRSLRVYDNDTGTDTSIVKPFLLPQSSVILEFVLYPVAVGADQGAIQFGILGEGTDVYSSVFHMKVSDNRSLAYYDGSAWKDVGDADTVAFNAWNVIRIEAHNTTDADIYVNDVLVGTAENFANAETLGGIRFATGGTRQTGDDFYVDNVSVKGDNAEGELEVFNLPINEAFDSDPVGEAPAGYLIMKSDANAEAVVSDEQAYDSSHSLWVNGRVELVKFFTPESSTKMEFMIYPIEANSGISFGFGNGINIKLGPDGDLHYKRGSGWYIISDPGNVKFNTWNKITIDAPSTNFARVYINDEYAGIAPGDLKVNAFNRIHFSTANASKDAEFYVDDISVDHGTPELEAPAYTAAEITPHSVISLDSTIGYLNNDIAPASGSIQNWGDTRSFEFDYERRSIGIDLGESKKVNAIKLWDSDKMSRLN